MKFSEYQEAIFRHVEKQAGHLVIEAVAGAGKTTTLKEIGRRLPQNQRILFCAFNRHIADELRGQLPEHISLATIHSLGRKALNGAQLNQARYWHLIRAELSENYKKYAWLLQILPFPEATSYLRELLHVAQSYLAESGLQALEHALQIGIPPVWNSQNQKKEIAHLLDTLLDKAILSFEKSHEIDFPDMLWLPHQLQLAHKLPKFDVILVDEAQDLSRAQLNIVLNCLAPGGRIIAVGDPHQAIYAFAGADPDSLARIKHTLQAESLPLAACYRCPKNHILQLAQRFNPRIQPARHDSGPLRSTTANNYKPHPGDLIICRQNQPLVELALDLLKQKIPCQIRGKDLLSHLKSTIRSTAPDPYSPIAHLHRIDQWTQIHLQALQDMPQQKQDFLDKINCIKTLVSTANATSLSLLELFLDSMFADHKKNNHTIWLSTIHRAKGLEANSVVLLPPKSLIKPSTQTEALQERNLNYIAATRAKHSLLLLDNPI
ncbi:MAG: UvrD-helicase domain-containing protein [Methylacidiphilales bacterium]|nr:UvrD-helicase domain-containing protein [Candidatus Methylacidiphilales bacterium]